MIRTVEKLQYDFRGPFMNAAVAPLKVPVGMLGRLVGADGRYPGCLRKFYGMDEVVDLVDVTTTSSLATVDDYDGVSFFRCIAFQKRTTTDIYRGFVVRWDKYDNNNKEQVNLVWTIDNGTNWAGLEIWAGASSGTLITSTTEMWCEVDGPYLYVCAAGQSPKTIYYDGSNLVAVDMGPGAYSAELAVLTDDDTAAVDSSYNLRGNGTYQVAWRFYDSKRGIYSALSAPLTVTLDLMKTTKATGGISFNIGGSDSGLMVAGDIITINSRNYEYIDSGPHVTIAAAGAATIAAHAIALAGAINGDSSAVVTARAEDTSVLLESKIRGSTGNGYNLSVTETGSDLTASGTYLTGGGVSTSEPEEHCKAVLSFPLDDAVITSSTWAKFEVLFDTVDVFRTIDLGTGATATQGAVFYLEQTLDKATYWVDENTWDAVNVTLGSKVDEALPFQTMYNPEIDIVKSPPASGTIGRYQDITFMADVWGTTTRGVDTVHSSMEHESGEYFSTYNIRKGTVERGSPLRYQVAGDSMFVLSPGGITHVYKSAKAKPLQFVDLHEKRGLAGKEAAHTAGNSVFMVTNLGLVMLSGSNGNMGQISTANRILSIDWVNDLSTIKSAYDSLMDTSFFLHPGDSEMLQICHSTQAVSMLEGANFVGASSGLDIPTGLDVRAHFVTKTGLVVIPDLDEGGSGSMWALSSSYTLDGTTTTASAGGTHILDSGATFHADMVGALAYMTSGANAGLARRITAMASGDLTVSAFPNAIALGDRYSISPVPFSVRCWPLQDPDPRVLDEAFKRWKMVSVSLKVTDLGGFTGNDNDIWRLGTYRNGASSLTSGTSELDVSANPADSVASLVAAGIDVEPYIEQIACGVTFELTAAEIGVKMADSRDDAASA